ncbi:hypothetical protein RYX36_035057 [Vicia faba]
MLKWRVPFVPSPSNSEPERDRLEFVCRFRKEFEEEENKMYETLIKHGFLTEAERIADYRKENITIDISRTCFGKKQNAIRMVDAIDGKGYHCVILRAGRNVYEKHIGHEWYTFAKEKKLQSGDVLEFSMVPFSDLMFVFLVNRC